VFSSFSFRVPLPSDSLPVSSESQASFVNVIQSCHVVLLQMFTSPIPKLKHYRTGDFRILRTCQGAKMGHLRPCKYWRTSSGGAARTHRFNDLHGRSRTFMVGSPKDRPRLTPPLHPTFAKPSLRVIPGPQDRILFEDAAVDKHNSVIVHAVCSIYEYQCSCVLMLIRGIRDRTSKTPCNWEHDDVVQMRLRLAKSPTARISTELVLGFL